MRTIFVVPRLAAAAVLQREELRAELGQRAAKFRELLLRAVDLETRQFRESQGFRKKTADILQVHQNALRIHVTFSAMNLVAVEAETVIEAFRLTGRLGHEPLT